MEIELTLPQTQFLDLDCKYPLFVAGYGSGKSEILKIGALDDVFSYPGARVAVYSDTFDQLRLNLVPRFQDALSDLGVSHDYNKTENIITFDFEDGRNEMIFRSIDNPKRIIGYEVFRSHVDEIEAADNEKKAGEVWRKIIARNRQKIAGAANRVSVYTTPDQGFGFTYKKWGQSTSPDYQYVRASSRSNPHTPSDYVESLENDYPPELVRAFVEGHWCNLTSGSVYASFSRDFHNSTREVKSGEPLHVGMDFNVGKMAAIVFVQDGKGTVATDELIGYADTPSMIEALKERFDGHAITVYPDASGKNTSSKGASLSDIALLRAAGFTVRAHESNPRVRARVVCVNARFVDGTVRVNVVRCPQLTESLERQKYTDAGEPDKSQGFDHPVDAFGYRIAYTYALKPQVSGRIWVK